MMVHAPGQRRRAFRDRGAVQLIQGRRLLLQRGRSSIQFNEFVTEASPTNKPETSPDRGDQRVQAEHETSPRGQTDLPQAGRDRQSCGPRGRAGSGGGCMLQKDAPNL